MSRPVLALLLGAALSLLPAAALAAADFGPPAVPAGFRIAPVIRGIHHPTRLVFGPDGRLYIAQQTGEVIAVSLKGGEETGREEVAAGHTNLLGLALKGDQLWLSDTGTISVYTRGKDGRYGDRREIVREIPHGRHENDGLAWGPDGKLYWGLGTTTDLGPEPHPWSGSIMRMNPDGSAVEVYAHGLRNPYGIAFGPDGRLWATDNGTDDPGSPDKLHLIVSGGDYGFPKVTGIPPAGSSVRVPVALFPVHDSTDGLVVYSGQQFPARYRGGIFVAEWGSSYDETTGRAVGFVQLTARGDAVQGTVTPFATGFNRPLDVTMGPDGDLWVGDFVAGVVYRIWYDAAAAPEPPAPAVPTAPPPTPPVPPGTVPVPAAPAPAEQPHRIALSIGAAAALLGGVAVLALALLLWRRRHPPPR